MLVAKDLEVRAGARLLLERVSFQVAAGDKIGLVGRNGAGKTTLTRILAGGGQPAAGGYAAEAEAARIASSLGLPERVLHQPIRTLSGGQRRRVELARILFSGAPTMLLDEPTNHLDADSIVWLRDFLRAHDGGVVVINHDVDLLDKVVNKVWHLDANRAEADVYNVGWKKYLEAREQDERRRRRERA